MKSIFVSSTFRDMNFERDTLNKAIGPKLNLLLSRYNQSLRILDLRWGVDTSDLDEQQASERVLKVCFDQLDRCQPYIIILLGDRYGYIPDNSNISVTHMEILRGAIESVEKDHVLIYFRDADYSSMPEDLKKVYVEQNEQAKSKLDKLKKDLAQMLPDRCRTYSAYWCEERQQLVSQQFEQMVQQDFEDEFIHILDNIDYSSALHRQIAENDEILADNVKFAYKNDRIIESSIEAITSSTTPLGFIGNGGSGKSVFLSLLCSQMRKNGLNVDILFCGDNQFSSSVRNAAEYLVYALTKAAGLQYDFKAHENTEYSALLNEAIGLKSKVQSKCYIILDAVDKCDNGMVNFILWCYRFLAEQVKVVFSSRDSQEIMDAEQSLDLVEIKYNKEDLYFMATCLLNKHGKAINRQLTEAVCNKAENPLHLNIMLTRLLNLSANDFAAIEKLGGGMDAINTYLNGVIEKSPEDTPNAICDYIGSQMEQGGDNDNFVPVILGLLSYSPYGLHEYDMQAMFDMAGVKWTEIDYVDFLAKYAIFIRTRDNGRIDISHDVIRYTLCQLLSARGQLICSLMATYFLQKKEQDAYTIRSFIHIAHQGGCQRALIDFLEAHYPKNSSFESENEFMRSEIKRCIVRDFLSDGGDFVFGASQLCQSGDELLHFHAILTNSLYSYNNYLTDEEAFLFARAALAIPVMAETFPAAMMQSELDRCQKFIAGLNIHNEEFDSFFKEYEQAIRERRVKQGAKDDDRLYSDSPREMLDLLKDSNQNFNNRMIVLSKLTDIIRKMGKNQSTAQQAVDYAHELLDALKQFDFGSKENWFITHNDLYVSLGEAYKNLQQWEEAIKYDQYSADLYEKEYKKNRSDMLYRKYRERIYNVANTTEKWAMTEDTNLALWQKTRDLYEKIYKEDVLAIAQGIPERELLQCAGTIFSYGTALLKSGDPQGATEKYHEAMKIILELAEGNPRPDLYLDLCAHTYETVYLFAIAKDYQRMNAFFGKLTQYISTVLGYNQDFANKELMDMTISFINATNSLFSQWFAEKDLDGAIELSHIAIAVRTAVISIAPYELKADFVVAGRNAGDLYYLHKGDYDNAVKQYVNLLNLVNEHNLLVPDNEGNYRDNATLILVDVLIRIIICFDRLDMISAAKEFLEKLPAWCKYLCDRSQSARDNIPYMLYTVAANLSHNQCRFAHNVLVMSYTATKDDNYDVEKNQETVALITQSLFGGTGNQNT